MPSAAAESDNLALRVERRAATTYCAVPIEVTMASIGERVPEAIDDLERYMASRGIEAVGPSLIRYRSVSDEHPFTIEVGWVTREDVWIDAPFVADALPQGDYAVSVHHGPYADLSAATARLLEWGAGAGLDFAAGRVGTGADAWECWYEFYVSDPVVGPHGPEGAVEICLLLR